MAHIAYVHVSNIDPNEPPLLCGRLTWLENNVGVFRYANSFLENKQRFSLDPINMPLTNFDYSTELNHGIHGPINDAGPDDWGKQIMVSIYNRKPKTPLDYILYGSGHGTGCLLMSGSRDKVKTPTEIRAVTRWADVQRAIDQVSSTNTPGSIDRSLQALVAPGSSLGGATPKTIVSFDNEQYLAKFNQLQDPINTVRVEHASLELAKACGIYTVDSILMEKRGVHAILVKRFDRYQHVHHHYISAHSIINMHRASTDDINTRYSYPALAETMGKFVTNTRPQKLELFRRMVFNVLIGNTDDHTKNHGFIFDRIKHTWSLSPAFDIVPQITGTRTHAIALGKEGRHASVDNMLSMHESFQLTHKEAMAIIKHISFVLSGWKDHYRQYSVTTKEIQLLGRCVLTAPPYSANE